MHSPNKCSALSEIFYDSEEELTYTSSVATRELKHQTFLVPRTPTGSIFAAWQPLRMSRPSWLAVTDFKTRVLGLKPEVQILRSSRSIRHTKVKFFVWNHVFFERKKQNFTQIFERHFQMNYSVGVRDGFTLVCSMICIWRVNRVPDPVLRRQSCLSWIKNVWWLSSLLASFTVIDNISITQGLNISVTPSLIFRLLEITHSHFSKKSLQHV